MLKRQLPYDSDKFTHTRVPKRNGNMRPRTNLYMCVPRSVIRNSPAVRTLTPPPFEKRTNKPSSTHAVEYYSAIKRVKEGRLLRCGRTSLENTTQGEMHRTQNASRRGVVRMKSPEQESPERQSPGGWQPGAGDRDDGAAADGCEALFWKRIVAVSTQCHEHTKNHRTVRFSRRKHYVRYSLVWVECMRVTYI